MPIRIAWLSAAALGAVVLTGCFIFIVPVAAQDMATKSAGMSPSKNIFQSLATSSDHTALVTAIRSAGVVDVFKTNRPLTVFAPTNDAFGKLHASNADALLMPRNAAKLAQILTYHVVARRLAPADFTDGRKFKTVQGEDLTVRCAEGKVMIVDANDDAAIVTIANVNQSNGVVYSVDTVLMPKAWSQFLPSF